MIYFRCGYSPDQYFGDKEWNARLMMERSLAIKSPSIHYHLAGTKKVQQQLAVNGVLEKYFDDSKKVDKIRGIFTGLYSLDATVSLFSYVLNVIGSESQNTLVHCNVKFFTII